MYPWKISILMLKTKMNFNYIDESTLSISIDEKDDLSNVNDILEVFAKSCNHSDSKNLIEEVLQGDYYELYNKIPEKKLL